MKRIVSTVLGLAALCLFAEAHAVPATVSFTGRLTTTNGPVSGNVTLTFSLFNQATNGTVMWTETRPGVMANAGLVYVDLGALTTLDEGVLSNSALYLEINVGGEILSPRLGLQSVPYAIRSEVANSADLLGTLAAADVVTTVTGGGGVTANRTGNTVTLGANTSTLQARITGMCGPNASISSVSATGTVTCEADSDTTYTAAASSGVALTGTAFGLTSACASGQVLKAGAGGAWACANDTDTTTTYTPVAGGGVAITGTAIGLTTCASGQVLKAGATAGTWACAADTDTTTTYTAVASGGVSVTGTAIGLTTCASGQVLKAGAGGTWACAADTDTNTTYSSGSGVTMTGTVFATDNTVVARKDSAAGNQIFNNRIGISNSNPTELLDVAGPVRFDAIRLFRKVGNNGGASCSTFCQGAQWGGGVGVCFGAKLVTGPSAGAYVSCDAAPGAGIAELQCMCAGIP